MRVALAGGKNIKKYSLADILWQEISELSDISINFGFFPLLNKNEFCRFYEKFSSDKNFVGFNVALPWKGLAAQLVNKIVQITTKPIGVINTVYKYGGEIYGFNTDVIGIEKPLLKRAKINRKKILVIGAGGAGLSCAIYLSDRYNADITLYDIAKVEGKPKNYKLRMANSIKKVSKIKYDIIINASPVGKMFKDTIPHEFSLPIGINIFNKIIHRNTIVQEMNYFPNQTELLHLAKIKKLEVISGVEMLVHQGISSFQLYSGKEFPPNKIDVLIKRIVAIAEKLEENIYEKRIGKS